MTLVPVDYDPFAQPPKTKRAPAPTPDVYEPTSAFVGSLGPGYRDTSDYRSEAKERQLGAEGAGVARGISNHSRGTPQAPGAHDIVPTGDWNQALDRLRALTGVKDAFIESAHGPEGRHIHVDMTPGYRGNAAAPAGGKLTPVDYNPFAAQPAAGKGKLTPVDYNPFASTPVSKAQPKPNPVPGLAEAFGSGAFGTIESLAHQLNIVDPKGWADRIQQAVDLATGGAQAVGMSPESAQRARQGMADLRKRVPGHLAETSQEEQERLHAYHAPQGMGEDIAETAGSLAPGMAVGPEADMSSVPGIMRAVAGRLMGQVALPTAGSVAAGAAAHKLAPNLEPAARAAGMVAGGLGAGLKLRPKVAPDADPIRTLTEQPTEPPRPTAAAPRLATAAEKAGMGKLRKLGPLEPERQRPILDSGPADEPLERTMQRHEDALYALRGDAEVSRAMEAAALKKIPGTPQMRESLYHAIEAPMADKSAVMPPVLDELHEEWKPLQTLSRSLYDEIKQMSPQVAKVLDEQDHPETAAIRDQTYVHRIRLDKPGSPLDRMGAQDPMGGRRGRGFSRRASSLNKRSTFVMESADGTRTYIPKELAIARPNMKIGDKLPRGTDGKVRTVQPATTMEVEANDPQAKYLKDPFVTMIHDIAEKQRVRRNLQYINSLKPDLQQRGLMWTKTTRWKGDDGIWRSKNTKGSPPAGFEKVPGLLGFEDDYFQPRLQKVFKDYVALGPDEPFGQMFENVSRLLIGSLFYNPVLHDLNIAGMALVGRGAEWMRPTGWLSLVRNGLRASDAVDTMNNDYLRALREGLPLQFSRAANADVYKMMIRAAGLAMKNDPGAWGTVARALGFKTLSDMTKAYYRAANLSMWKIGDKMMMQRWYELQERGMSIEEATKQAGTEIASYRVPTEVFGQRWVTNIINATTLAFSRFHYSLIKSIVSMAKFSATGSDPERLRAAGQWLAFAVMAFQAAPILNKALQKLTGNKNAKFRGFGPFAYADRAIELSQGQKDAADVIGSVITPTPATEGIGQSLTGRNYYGKPLIEPEASPLGKGVEAGEAVAGDFPPTEPLMGIAQPGGLARSLAAQVGVELPTPKQVKYWETHKGYDKKDAARREAKDPIEQAVKHMLETTR